MSSALRLATAVAVSGLLAACAHTGPGAAPDLAGQLAVHDIVLLGEVHDNTEGHRLRTEAIRRAVREGWRPAVAMEQFDRPQQARLDKAMQACADASCVIQKTAPDASGWEWAYYEPVINLALEHGLRVLAANLSRADAAEIMKQGLGAVFPAATRRELRLDGDLPPDLLKAQSHDVQQAHCGMLPARMVDGMAQAQVVRDAVMASVLRQALRDGQAQVVLLAGNGHVRKSRGVPRWLRQEDVLAVGFTESPANPDDYDREVVVAAVDRPDPCEGLQEHFQPKPAL